VLKVIIIVSETSLLIYWVASWVGSWVQIFLLWWVGLGQSAGGLGWAGSKKVDRWTTLREWSLLIINVIQLKTTPNIWMLSASMQNS